MTRAIYRKQVLQVMYVSLSSGRTDRQIVPHALVDNGQRWRIVDGGVTFPRPRTDPKVTIAPGFLGAWYLRLDDGTPPIKVQRVD